MSRETFVNLYEMSAREIVNYIREKTGDDIPVSLKSKRNVVSHAIRILRENGYETYGTRFKANLRDCPEKLIRGEIRISKMTASQIVSELYSRLGILLNYSLKSKKSIVKVAKEFFMFGGYTVS